MLEENIFQVKQCDEPGYLPMIDFANWRVALINDAERLKPENLTYLQRHNETDEVFVLLEGECTLIVSRDQTDSPKSMVGIRMKKNLIYNVRKGVWHSQFLAPGSKVLVVENRDTTPDNSPKVPLPYPVDPATLTYEEA